MSSRKLTSIENDLLLDNIIAKRKIKKVMVKAKSNRKDIPFELPKTKLNLNMNDKIVLGKPKVIAKLIPIQRKRNILADYIMMILGCLVIFLVLFIGESISNKDNSAQVLYEDISFSNPKMDSDYISCIETPLGSSLDSPLIDEYEKELNTYLKSNYNASVLYYDLNNGFKYEYNSNRVYYAASVAKIIPALYVYSTASAGGLDIDSTMTYYSSYKEPFSPIMSNHRNGDKVSLRELVYASISVSDNTAHKMLVNYIGKNKLRTYGRSLGAKYTMNTDNFGNIDINDAYCYLDALNKYLNNGDELSLELKNLLLEADFDDISLEELDIYAAHKYGSYGGFYHNVGIVYDNNPYILVILTRNGGNKERAVISDISENIYQLHRKYYREKERYCLSQIKNSLM